MFTPAWSRLAEAQATIAFQRFEPAGAAAAKSVAAARRALELDPGAAEALACLGWIAFFHDRQYDDAAMKLRRAAESSSCPRSHLWLAFALAARGRFDEALAQLESARRTDPLSSVVANETAVILYFARRYSACERYAQETLKTEPGFWPAMLVTGCSRAAQGRHQDAVVYFMKATSSAGRPNSEIACRLAYSQALSGNLAKARQTADELERSPSPYLVHAALACTGLGDFARAIQLLHRAADEREADINFIGVDPLFDPLRNQPAYPALIRKIRK